MEIQKITLFYKRTTIITREDNPIPGMDGPMIVRWISTEKIAIDRKTETVKIYRKLFEECQISIKYHLEGAVSNWLDGLDAETLFTATPDIAYPIESDSTSKRRYRASVVFDDGSERKMSGNYNKNELPKDFSDFINSLVDFMSYYGILGELFSDEFATDEEKAAEE